MHVSIGSRIIISAIVIYYIVDRVFGLVLKLLFARFVLQIQTSYWFICLSYQLDELGSHKSLCDKVDIFNLEKQHSLSLEIEGWKEGSAYSTSI